LLTGGPAHLEARMQRPAIMLFAVIFAFFAVLGGRWLYYVTRSASPYDEVGIGLMLYMPEPLRAWGCARLKERFPRQLPPAGCDQR
jgi:hypothetical protein